MSQARNTKLTTNLSKLDNRMAVVLRNMTLQRMNQSIKIVVVCAVICLLNGWSSIVITFIGLLGVLRLTRPHNYPFTFSKKQLQIFRSLYILTIMLGVTGIVLNHHQLQPLADWFSE